MLKERETVNALRGGLNAFLVGLTVFVSLLGFKVLFGGELAVSSGAHSLVVGNSAGKLEVYAKQLEAQAKLIQQKEQAYNELEAVYNQSLKGKQGYGKLQKAIETIEDLPPIDNINEVRSSILETKEELLEVGSED